MAQTYKANVSTPNPYALRRPVFCPYGGNWSHSLRAPAYCKCPENIRSTEAWKESIRNQCENGFHRCADFQVHVSNSITITIGNTDFVEHTIEPNLQISDDVGLLVRQ